MFQPSTEMFVISERFTVFPYLKTILYLATDINLVNAPHYCFPFGAILDFLFLLQVVSL